MKKPEDAGEDLENKNGSEGINEDMSFEESLEQLESLVDKLERGQLLLDESIDVFEKGMRLARICNQKLSKAERKIEVLIEENGKLKTDTFIEDR
ncbi:exodeoxyribonuclease VII small subunit [Methanolobus halotolerans]|uniref:Exodeoxyribonuclease VII small subunit n=1 Tax=Methanolobus halotolerans TaxID=2052935 RepID=A0A4E0PU78_9EURY|nr:exodeoxyribonuclease VII small subunit [Methanolobus halotolerans]TGC08499.1 exodeoxyribonuclease VII small subunit [Methanolobus halotolerans]